MLQIIENNKLKESLVQCEKTFLIRQKLKLIIEIILMKDSWLEELGLAAYGCKDELYTFWDNLLIIFMDFDF